MMTDVQSSIGRAITVKGSVHADEPIAIGGTITGDVFAGDNGVTIEPDGHVAGTITARHIVVRGAVHGRLVAKDLVRLEATSTVEADIASPGVAIEDGATYKGRVEPARAEAAARVAAYRQGS
jgi:cytoskeletal protein CcmA (bactofilin family)